MKKKKYCFTIGLMLNFTGEGMTTGPSIGYEILSEASGLLTDTILISGAPISIVAPFPISALNFQHFFIVE